MYADKDAVVGDATADSKGCYGDDVAGSYYDPNKKCRCVYGPKLIRFMPAI